MGLKRLREDSIKELKKKKTNEELQKENEELQGKVNVLEEELTSTQLALCDVYEMMLGGV